MPKYRVTITATVTKEIEVDAEDEESAEDEARELFTAAVDEYEEKYEEYVDSIVEV